MTDVVVTHLHSGILANNIIPGNNLGLPNVFQLTMYFETAMVQRKQNIKGHCLKNSS